MRVPGPHRLPGEVARSSASSWARSRRRWPRIRRRPGRRRWCRAPTTGAAAIAGGVCRCRRRADVDVDAAARGARRRTLPAYMVPAAVMVLDAFPLNATGKLDRRALPAAGVRGRARIPRAAHARSRRSSRACSPRCSASDRVGVDDDFFALGGNSLIATQVVRAPRRRPGRASAGARAVRGADRGRAGRAAGSRRCADRVGRCWPRARVRTGAAVAGAAADVVPQPVRSGRPRPTTCRSWCG